MGSTVEGIPGPFALERMAACLHKFTHQSPDELRQVPTVLLGLVVQSMRDPAGEVTLAGWQTYAAREATLVTGQEGWTYEPPTQPSEVGARRSQFDCLGRGHIRDRVVQPKVAARPS